MKLWKWHTLVFRCPTCGKHADYAAQVLEGPHKGSVWDPAYWCEKCNSLVRARDQWLFGAVFGPVMAMVAAFAVEAVPAGLQIGAWSTYAFAALCCGIVGWPLSRTLSRHLVWWEPCESAAARAARLRRLRGDDESPR